MTKQEQAIELVNKGNPFTLITGSGGVGKTYTMKQLVNESTLIVAPTGVAALNAGGVTAHKLFKLPIGLISDKDYHLNLELSTLLKATTRLIIDEMGMIRADVLDLINWKCRRARGVDKPFGGIQVVLVGDFFQLESIVGYNERKYFFEEYDTPFLFGSNVFIQNPPKIIELTEVYRNKNKRQVKMLNSIRKKDRWYKHAIKLINDESKPYDPNIEQLHLCCYKADAKEINDRWYDKLQGTEYTCYAKSTGHWKENEQPVPPILKLKVGCKVLLCANDMNGQYVNGDRGIITSISRMGVIVLLNSGKEVLVEYNKWEKYNYKGKGKSVEKEVEAEYEQLPIKLGWAITVHASQGLTLDDIAIHLGRGCFSHGQLYVALSRVKDLKNISLVNKIKYSDCIVNQDVINFYNELDE